MRTLLTLFILLLLLPFSGKGQIINTIVGTGEPGYTGDGGSALLATLYGQVGLAYDKKGNLFLIDDNNVVRKVSPSGIINTYAGTGYWGDSGDGGPAIYASFRGAGAIAIDDTGNVYVTDEHNYVVRKIDTFGTIRTIAGNRTLGYSGDGGLAVDAQLNQPYGLAIDSMGNLYIIDESYTIRKVTPAGIISTFAGTGVLGYTGDGGQATSAQIGRGNIAHDKKGTLYFTDPEHNCIRKVDRNGIILTVVHSATYGFGGDGGLASSATIYGPEALTADSSGDIYFSDGGNGRIRHISRADTIITIAGNGSLGFSGDGGSPLAASILPAGIAVDPAGNVVFGQSNRVRRIRKSGVGVNHDEKEHSIAIAPNPSTGEVTITFPSNVGDAKVVVSSVLGQQVGVFNTNSCQPFSFQLHQPAGLYFVTVTTVGASATCSLLLQ